MRYLLLVVALHRLLLQEIARVTSSIMSPLSRVAVDYFKRNHPERGGRAVVLASGILISTASFMLHAAIPGGKVGYHVFLVMMQLVGGTMTYPVIDGLTLGFLEETKEGRDSYGKERLYGKIPRTLHGSFFKYYPVHV